jgi:hypothetical protein
MRSCAPLLVMYLRVLKWCVAGRRPVRWRRPRARSVPAFSRGVCVRPLDLPVLSTRPVDVSATVASYTIT